MESLKETFKKYGEVTIKFTSISYPFNEYVGCWIGKEEAENGQGGMEIMLDPHPIKTIEGVVAKKMVVVDLEFKDFGKAMSWACDQLVELLP